MLYLNLKRVLRLRGIEKPNKFIVNLGFAPATARNLLRNKIWRMDFEHLERFCLALNCTPNDLLQWIPPENRAGAETQALIKLKRDDKEDLSKLLGSLPMEKFEQVKEILQQELKNK